MASTTAAMAATIVAASEKLFTKTEPTTQTVIKPIKTIHSIVFTPGSLNGTAARTLPDLQIPLRRLLTVE
jgi:hypothetical protein